MAYTNIDKPTDYFNTKLYAGNGSTGQSITGVGFQPDFIWFKNRTTAGYFHELYDVIRGVRKPVYSNATNSEGTTTASLESFDSDGFSVDSEDASGEGVNRSGDNYVAWNWKAGGTASSNTDGSITSSVSANTTAGFSIVSYTGTGSNATVGHGLGAVPKMMIVRNRTSVTNWHVYHEAIGATKYLHLNLTNAEGTASSVWNNTAPTSSVFSIGSGDGTNKNTDNIIAYCFAEKKGFSKFGSYTGNANDNGTFSYTGFKPAWVMIKRTDVIKNWYLIDNKRENYNPNHETTILFANSSNAEQTLPDREVDFLSNGFKLRGSDGDVNASGGTYIYMAFAENPLVGSNFVPNNAR